MPLFAHGAGPEAMAKYAAELVALTPDVILAATSVNVAALQRITRTIPIVFVQVIDPVSAGFVDVSVLLAPIGVIGHQATTGDKHAVRVDRG